MSPTQWNVDAELQSALTVLQASLERAAVFASLGDQAHQGLAATVDLPPPRVVAMFGSPQTQARALGAASEEFAADCARYAVLAMIAACEVYLGYLVFVLRLADRCTSRGVTIAEVNDLRADVGQELRNTAVDRLIAIVTEGQSVSSDVEDQIRWFRACYAMRKCLVHRGGRVGREDVGPTGTLDVTWRTVSLHLNGEPVSELPLLAKGGGRIEATFEDTARSWARGEAIVLSAQDCNDIALSLAFFAHGVAGVLHARLVDLINARRSPGEADTAQ